MPDISYTLIRMCCISTACTGHHEAFTFTVLNVGSSMMHKRMWLLTRCLYQAFLKQC